MKASRRALNAVKEFEGLRPAAYRDSAGVWTIGYGHTIGVKPGMKIAEDKAEEFLFFDMKTVEIGINRLDINLTQAQFDALCSFVFNLGIGNLKKSTLLKKIKAHAQIADVQREFRKWVYADGKKLAGLVTRREWEARTWAMTY